MAEFFEVLNRLTWSLTEISTSTYSTEGNDFESCANQRQGLLEAVQA